MLPYEGGVDIVEDVCPNFTDIYDRQKVGKQEG